MRPMKRNGRGKKHAGAIEDAAIFDMHERSRQSARMGDRLAYRLRMCVNAQIILAISRKINLCGIRIFNSLRFASARIRRRGCYHKRNAKG
jgi:hypothetical protein